MPKPPSILRPSALVLSTSALKVHIPLAMVVWLGVICASRAVAPTLEAGPVPLPVPQVPLQETTPAGSLPVLAAALPGSLPSPGPNQKRAGKCDQERSQVELAGGCWVKTDHPLPCPRGKQWEHEGRCWLPVAEAKPVPTSGEGRPLGVADP